MIRVLYFRPDNVCDTFEYPGHYQAKIVHGGTLRIEEPEAFDVPELGQDKDKQIGKKDAKPIAVFSGNYVVEYLYEPEHD